MSLSAKEVKTLVKKLEIQLVHCKHHYRGYFCYKGTKVIPIFYSHGSKDLPGYVTEKLAKSMQLSKEQIVSLARCRISKAEYIEILKKKEIIS